MHGQLKRMDNTTFKVTMTTVTFKDGLPVTTAVWFSPHAMCLTLLLQKCCSAFGKWTSNRNVPWPSWPYWPLPNVYTFFSGTAKQTEGKDSFDSKRCIVHLLDYCSTILRETYFEVLLHCACATFELRSLILSLTVSNIIKQVEFCGRF